MIFSRLKYICIIYKDPSLRTSCATYIPVDWEVDKFVWHELHHVLEMGNIRAVFQLIVAQYPCNKARSLEALRSLHKYAKIDAYFNEGDVMF